MPNRRVVLILLFFSPFIVPVAALASAPEGLGQCLQVPDGRCPAADRRATGRTTGPDPGLEARAPGPHALRFDGVDDIVTVRSSRALTVSTAFTLEAWVRPERDARPRSCSVIAGKDGEFLLGRTPQGALEWALNLTSSGFVFVEVPWATVPAGVWSHVAITYDGARVRTFVNGLMVATQMAAGAIRPAAPPVGLFRIGGRYHRGRGAAYFAGVIDDVRLWNVARGDRVIAFDRTRRLRGDEPGLIGYWRLDEGRGGEASDAARGHAGLLANGPTWVDGRPDRFTALL